MAAQLACLRDVRPDWASVSVREVSRSPDLAPKLYALCKDQGTQVQHILYDAEDAELLAHWQQDGTVRPGQADRLLVLGRYTTNQQSCPDDLNAFPPAASDWMVCAFGTGEHACLQESARRGADLRVGFENSLTDQNGTAWADNAASVAALVAALEKDRA